MTRFFDLIAFDALADGETKTVMVEGWQVLAARVGGQYYALNNRCAHAAAPLTNGRLRGHTLTCPLHGARFDIKTGQCIGAPYNPLQRFQVVVEDARVRVCLPDRPPHITELPIAPLG